MKKNLIDFTEKNINAVKIYDQLRPCCDNVMRFGDRVLVAQANYRGEFEGAVYGFVENPDECWCPSESELILLKVANQTFEDAGHAIEWCIKNAH